MIAPRRAVILIERLLFVVAAGAVTIACIDWWFGGYEFHLFGIRFASRHALKPFRIALRAGGAAALIVIARRVRFASVWLYVRMIARRVRFLVARCLRSAWSQLEVAAPSLAALAALAAGAVGVAFGTYAATGADTYGYISQAMLWLHASLHVPQPLAAIVPWPDAEWSLSPLGYRPATTPGAIVPVYSPGLPMVMAVLARIGGPSAVYLAVPALGALTVWCTFLVGRKLGGWATGLLSAMLVAASPVFLFSVVVPMSDLAVTGWWTAAIALATTSTPVATASAGIAAAAALVTRPNLLPLGFVLGGFVWLAGGVSRRERATALMLFAAGFLPGCLVVAWIYDVLYGSPLTSGYGRVEDLYRLANIIPNLRRYPVWVVDAQSPFICLGLAAPALLWKTTNRHGTLIGFFLVWIAAVLACYLPWMPLDQWIAIRYLLPALPVAVVLSSAVTIALIDRMVHGLRIVAFSCVCLVLVPMYIERATTIGAFHAWLGERRAIETAQYIERQLPPDAVVFAGFHSGSILHYAQRHTIRTGTFAPEWLDRGLVFLRNRGYAPYIVVEDWELPLFRTRFARHSPIGALDWPPLAEIEGNPIRVLVFDPRDRERHLAGEQLATVHVPVRRN